MDINRREFIKKGAIGGATLLLYPACLTKSEEGGYVPPELRRVSNLTLNLYRNEFDITRGTSTGYSPHCVNC
ncbi:MAG: twin-arginine translocation signal domain-containing protein, partial [Nitrospinae bacterium]|nr:twin-arginine translocation signal domain-containing protein [Nitrospinota bacterium]